MSLEFHWFLPTTGDSRSLVGGGHSVPRGIGQSGHGVGSASQFRPPTIDYLAQVAHTAELLGFSGALTPTGTWCEDAWLTTAALIRETERLKFLVAFRPGSIHPTLAAQMASTYQRISDGRLLLNIVSGGEPSEQRRFGDPASYGSAERYARTDEFLTVLRGAWDPEGVNFSGDFYDVEDARVRDVPDPLPKLYFGGSSGPRRTGGGQARRRLPHLGRAAVRRGREARPDAAPREGAGSQPALRDPAARDHARHQRSGLGRGGADALRARPG